MSFDTLPRVCGDGLLIPRIEPSERGTQPAFEGMGILVGPAIEPGAIAAVVTGRQRHYSQLLGTDNQPVTEAAYDFQLHNDQLVTQLQSTRHGRGALKRLAEWPLPGSYILPFELRQGTELTSVTHIDLPELDVLFDDDRRRYDNQQTINEYGFGVYALSFWHEHRYGSQQPRERLREYHQAKVLIGAAKAGELAVAMVGKLGASEYILAKSGRRLSHRGGRDLEVADGIVRSRANEEKPTRIASLHSRRLRKVEL